MPGFVGRHDAAAAALAQAFPTPGFAAVDLRALCAGVGAQPRSFAPQPVCPQPDASCPPAAEAAAGPRHFSPADPDAKPTEGWDLLNPDARPSDYIDPLAAAHAAGYAEGMAAAAAACREAEERDRALMDGLADRIGAGSTLDRTRIARHLRQTVLALVTKLVGEVGIAPDVLASRIEGATKLLADSSESALLRVHPDDVPLLAGRLPATIFAAGDPALARGSFVLESASSLVEDGPDLWLEQLAAAIEIVPVPKDIVATC
ncbi:flagellar assembly protein FliH [Sphingomonas gellani]|uniref:Flagellar assembly protein FliH n=2 Tax=Sphingomonas gellani TaxID=1166340 RepID=A0A1H8CL94_9SPHN|nr:flagellar assembly protein FliH [Sphingomonas gellani]